MESGWTDPWYGVPHSCCAAERHGYLRWSTQSVERRHQTNQTGSDRERADRTFRPKDELLNCNLPAVLRGVLERQRDEGCPRLCSVLQVACQLLAHRPTCRRIAKWS